MKHQNQIRTILTLKQLFKFTLIRIFLQHYSQVNKSFLKSSTLPRFLPRIPLLHHFCPGFHHSTIFAQDSIIPPFVPHTTHLTVRWRLTERWLQHFTTLTSTNLKTLFLSTSLKKRARMSVC